MSRARECLVREILIRASHIHTLSIYINILTRMEKKDEHVRVPAEVLDKKIFDTDAS